MLYLLWRSTGRITPGFPLHVVPVFNGEQHTNQHEPRVRFTALTCPSASGNISLWEVDNDSLAKKWPLAGAPPSYGWSDSALAARSKESAFSAVFQAYCVYYGISPRTRIAHSLESLFRSPEVLTGNSTGAVLLVLL